uniref:Putative serine protease K12H4.7 n=1 Tax=Sipha flava TaxID=143950 RepID=A0A2S2Q4U6_9HEMI
MKYPHLIHATISSSNPLLAKVNFKVIIKSLSTNSQECVLQIKKANQNINLLLKTNMGAEIIERKFKLCDKLDRHNKKDVAVLYQSLAYNFAGVVQYNGNNRYYINPERSLLTMPHLYDIMIDESIPTSLDRYAVVNSKLLPIDNTDCLDHIYSKSIDLYSNTDLYNEAAMDIIRRYCRNRLKELI